MWIKNKLTMAQGDSRYLKLDCSNDPLTSDLDIGSHQVLNVTQISCPTGMNLDLTAAPSYDVRVIVKDDPGINRGFAVYNDDDDTNVFAVGYKGGATLFSDTGHGFVVSDYATQSEMFFYVIPGYGTGFNTSVSLNGYKLTCGEAEIDGDLNHDGTKVGFYGVAPAVRASGWSATGGTAKRSIDKSTVTVGDIYDALGTLINDLKNIGLIGG